jgi:beta-fructofuranosidase
VALRLRDRWVWDFWLADTGTDYHLFFLSAPRGLVDPIRRHRNASIGHAVSDDLVSWTTLSDALSRGEPGSWDDIATWTGSIIEVDGTWFMLYTGIASDGDGLVQRIGLVTSQDLIHWERFGQRPLIEADPTWYEVLDDGSAWHDQAWRDPWVFADPTGDGYHALICARSRFGPSDARGVIGHAVSPDLLTWEVRPPLVSPSGFGQMEVPQVVRADDSALILFSTYQDKLSASRRSARPGTGTYVSRGPGLLGPFAVPETIPFRPHSSLYSGKLVQQRDGRLALMGFVDIVDGEFVGEISDPLPFDLDAFLADDGGPGAAGLRSGERPSGVEARRVELSADE